MTRSVLAALALSLLIAGGSSTASARPPAQTPHAAETAALTHVERRHGGRWNAIRIGTTAEGYHRVELRPRNPLRRALAAAARITVVVDDGDQIVRERATKGPARDPLFGAPRRLWNSQALRDVRKSSRIHTVIGAVVGGFIAVKLGIEPDAAIGIATALTVSVLGAQEVDGNNRLRAIADEIAADEVNRAAPSAPVATSEPAATAALEDDILESAAAPRPVSGLEMMEVSVRPMVLESAISHEAPVSDSAPARRATRPEPVRAPAAAPSPSRDRDRDIKRRAAALRKRLGV